MIRDQQKAQKKNTCSLDNHILGLGYTVQYILFKMGRVPSLELNVKYTLGLFQTCKETEAVIFEQKVMKRR